MRTLELHNISKSFGEKQILKDVAITCKTGDIIGLFGRNGTGKSTLMKLVFGTLKADSIAINLNGKSISNKQIISKQTIGYLPQESFLPKNIKVRNVIPMFYNSSDEQDIIFHSPKVRSFDMKRVGDLSLGQRRYLEVLLIGNLEHPFLMLDEPFSMIEPLYKDEIKKLLKQLSSYKGILISDHYYDDVLHITNKNYVLKDANLHAVNSVEELQKFNYLKSR